MDVQFPMKTWGLLCWFRHETRGFRLLAILPTFRSHALSFFIFTLNKASASEQNVCKVATVKRLYLENHLLSHTLESLHK